MASDDPIALLAAHAASLTATYSRLTASPSAHVTRAQAELCQQLAAILQHHSSAASALLAAAEERVKDGWNRVGEWAEALGEPSAAQQAREKEAARPAEEQERAIEALLEKMKGRMEERGRAILALYAVLSELEGKLEETGWAGVGSLTLPPKAGGEEGWERLVLTEQRLAELKDAQRRAKVEVAAREMELSTKTADIVALSTELGFAVPAIANSISPASLDALRATCAELSAVKSERETMIQETYDAVYPLWVMLGVPDDVCEAFVDEWSGSTVEAVQAYQNELARMQALKRANLSLFIGQQRAVLASIWNELCIPDNARTAIFPSFEVDLPADDADEAEVESLLAAHETEVGRWTEELKQLQPALAKIAGWYALLKEIEDLAASAADPSRLLAKNNRGDPGRLLREEKARKRIAKQRPALEAELRGFIGAWEAQEGRPFEVWGERFLDIMARKEEEEQAERDAKRRPRAGAGAAPVPARLRPQGTGMSSSSGFGGGSQQPLKRQHTGLSTNSSLSAGSRPPPVKRLAPQGTGMGGRAFGQEIGNTRVLMPQSTGMGGGKGFRPRPSVLEGLPQPGGY